MEFNNSFFENNGIKLNYIESRNYDEYLTPLIYIPGTSGIGSDAIPLFQNLTKNRRCIGVSLRGRGRSDTPSQGYSLHDNASDIDALVKELSLNNYCLLGTSIGVMYSVIHLTSEFSKARGFIVTDHPPRCTKLPEGWHKWYKDQIVNGRHILDNMREIAVEKTESDAYDLDLMKEYKSLGLPTLALAAHKKGTYPILTSEEIEYFDNLPKSEVVHFYDSDHLIRYREPEKFYRVVDEFLCKLD